MVEEADAAQNAGGYLKKKSSKNVTARSSIIFSLEDKRGNKNEHLRLMDKGSSGGLISKEMVDKYDFAQTTTIIFKMYVIYLPNCSTKCTPTS